jgi:hypothetical protein
MRDLWFAVGVGAVVVVVSSVIGWRWSRRVHWVRRLGLPMAFLPGPWFAVIVGVYSGAVVGLAGAIARVVMR